MSITVPGSEYNGLSWADDENEDMYAQIVANNVRQINEQQRWRMTAAQRWSMLYAGHPDGDGVTSVTSMGGVPLTTVRNVCRQAVDTIHPRWAKHRPLPQALATSGEWRDMKRAKKMTQYLDGRFDKAAIFAKWWPIVTRDALVWGDGNLRVERWGKTMLIDRVMWWEYLLDSADARSGQPRFHYWVQSLGLGLALARYAKKRKGESQKLADERHVALCQAATTRPDPNWDFDGQVSSTVPQVRIVHAWHICDDEEAHQSLNGVPPKHDCNGRKAIIILDGEFPLYYGEWNSLKPGIKTVKCSEPLMGSRGTGLVRRLEGWQQRITSQEDRNDEAFRMAGGVALVCSSSANIEMTQLTNDAPVFKLEYDGMTPPNPVIIPTCDPAQVQRENSMQMQALSEMGISMQSAGGQKHPGVNSGVALETLDDIEDERWTMIGRAGEELCLDIGRAFIEIESDIAREFGEDAATLQVKMKGDIYTKLRWSDVSLSDFQVRVFPSSVLPQQVGERLQRLQSFFESGVIDRQTLLQQLGAPDLNSEIDLVTSGRVAIDEMLEAILDSDNQRELDEAESNAVPSNYLDYKWMLSRAQQWIWKGKRSGAPEENIDALRRVCDACSELISPEQTPGMPAMGAAPETQGGGMPGLPAPGMPPPGMPPAAGPAPGGPMPQPAAPAMGAMPIGNA